MKRYILTPQNMIVLESDSSNGWSRQFVTGNRLLIKDLIETANLALEYRAKAKADREESTESG